MNRFDLQRLRERYQARSDGASAPAQRPATTAPALGPATRTGAERPRILFLDDEERILDALAALFRYKYQVFTATTAERALSILRQCHVHVVVSDQRMPGTTGVDFLRQAKRVSPNSVRILLTGFSDLSAIIDSVNDGEVYRFLNKPWGNQEIQAVVADALAIGLALEAGSPATGDTPGSRVEVPSNMATMQPPAVLMLHESGETFEKVRQLLDPRQTFFYARTVEDCLDALRTGNIGVIVSDLQVGQRDTSEFLKLLKQEHPQILTIVVAESGDADHVVELINQAKIFRYLIAPFTPRKLKFFIDSALAQFQRYRRSPVLLGEQRPVIAVQAGTSRTTLAIRQRLRALRALLVPSVATGR
jgi:eukaryotic-like serine/threonine-protein kinase